MKSTEWALKTKWQMRLSFLTAYEFIKKQENDLKKIYFVSLNKKDFCTKGNNSIFHANLQSYADEVDMHYGNSLERLIEEIGHKKNGEAQASYATE